MSEPSGSPTPPALGRFAGLCAVDLTARLSYNMARTPVLPLFAAALGAGPEAVGTIVGASTITGIVFKAPAGAFSDHFGRRRTLLAGACVFAFTPFAYVWIGWWVALVVARLFHGLATSIYGPVATATAAELAGNRRGELLSWFSLIKIATNALGGLAGAGVIQWLGGAHPGLDHFRTAYVVAGVVGVFALLAAIVLLPGITGAEPDRRRSARDAYRKLWRGLRETVTHGRVILISGAESVQNMTMGALQAFLPILIVQKLHGSPMEAGLCWAGVMGTAVIAKPIMGRISDRYGRLWPILAGMALCAVPFAVMPYAASLWALAGLGVVFGLGEAFVTSSSTALVSEVCRREALGAAMGVFGTIADTGQALGPILVGVIAARAGYGPAFLVPAVLVMAWAVVMGVALRELRQSPPATK